MSNFLKDKNEQIVDLCSYGKILQDIQSFKSAGTNNGNEFNLLDIPGHLYFKIMFNFWNGDIDNPGDKITSGGLLSPTWNIINNNSDYHNYNSAWAYLKMNNENERAEKLEKFVNLLSNINIYSPWYFQSIEGLETALNRQYIMTQDFKIDERGKISIKCLKDSHDDRIGTLLDLYRDIIWSHVWKHEVIPANLRKFDMSIYIFSSPVSILHDKNGKYASFKESSSYLSSYKYLEFHNCEIDYNSITSGLSVLNNVEGVEPEYNIDIYFDDCYEIRYNEYMQRTIGDVILWDMLTNTTNMDGSTTDYTIKSEAQKDNNTRKDELLSRLNYYNNDKGILSEMAEDLINTGVDRINKFAKSLYLGNIYGFSLEKATYDIKDLMDGKIFNNINAAKDFVNNFKNKKPKIPTDLGNIYNSNTIYNNL